MCTRPISSRGDRFSSLCDYLFDESKSTAGTLRRGVVIVRDIESSFCVFFFLPRPTSRAPTGPRFAEDTGFRAKPYHLTGRSIEPGENRGLRGTGLRYVTRVKLLAMFGAVESEKTSVYTTLYFEGLMGKGIHIVYGDVSIFVLVPLIVSCNVLISTT